MATVTIPRGLDYLATIRSDQYLELPADLLGPGMKPFAAVVTFIGTPLNPPVGNADTIMERLADTEPEKEVATRLVAFANVSAAPILLEGDGSVAGWYDIYATLSPTVESPGKTIYHLTGVDGGTFDSEATFWPLLELRPLGGGQSIIIDTGWAPVPGFPMSIGSAGGSWSLRPPTPEAVRGFRSKPFFYHGQVVISATRDKNKLARVPMANPPEQIAKCAKIQAELTTTDNPGRLGRIRFGVTKRFANMEL
jgi:hypothetical protein